MARGILLEVEGRTGVVLTPGGEFRRVPLPRRGAFDVGDEIEFEERKGFRWAWAAAAAVLLLALLSPLAYQSVVLARPVALVLIDINPSIQLSVNGRQQVIGAEGLNDDGRQVLEGVAWRRRPVDVVTREITARAVALGKLDPAAPESAVVVAVAPVGNTALPEQVAVEMVDRSRSAVWAEVEAQAQARGTVVNAQVAAVEATPEEVRKAREKGLTVPKLIILEEVKASLPEVELDQEMLKEGPGQILKSLGLEPGAIFGKVEKRHNKGSHVTPSSAETKKAPAQNRGPGDSGKPGADKGERPGENRGGKSGGPEKGEKPGNRGRGTDDGKDRGPDRDEKGGKRDDDRGRGSDGDRKDGRNDGKDRRSGDDDGRGGRDRPDSRDGRGFLDQLRRIIGIGDRDADARSRASGQDGKARGADGKAGKGEAGSDREKAPESGRREQEKRGSGANEGSGGSKKR